MNVLGLNSEQIGRLCTTFTVIGNGALSGLLIGDGGLLVFLRIDKWFIRGDTAVMLLNHYFYWGFIN